MSMKPDDPYKICPICAARQHQNATICSTCGTAIADVEPQRPRGSVRPAVSYDDQHGEADLFEGSVRRVGRAWTAALLAIVILLGIGLAAVAIASSLDPGQMPAAPMPSPTRAQRPTVTWSPPTATHTPSPTLTLTATDTNTPAPCIQRVAAGDTLIHIVLRCGHNTRGIIPTVVALNRLADEARIQIGQDIVVPWPSPTVDPNARPTDTPESAALPNDAMLEDGLTLLAFDFDPFAPTATATLLPGLMWHTVQPDENMIVIAVQYSVNAKILSDLNPEIDFARCDFGMVYGGPDCIVNLYQGQQMRVPAPTPTPTMAPTLSGSETPTPLPSPTLNLPHAISPPDQAFFGRLEQVTLRWVATGRLAANEVYRVAVSDVESGDAFTADTSELFFIAPLEWQAPDARRHNYVWQVSVFDTETGRPLFSTAARTFVWQGAGESQP